MKKLIATTFFITALLTFLSFTNIAEYDITGTYGVSKNDPSKIELTLNRDNTFAYQDFSNSNKKIDVTGNWEVKNKHIVLNNYSSEFSFHHSWKIVKNGLVVKSRKGMTFYTLIKK